MTWRLIHFKTAKEPEIWRYRIGRNTIVILEPNGKRHNVPNNRLKPNVYNHRLASLHENHYQDRWNGIAPSDVKFYIHLRLRLGEHSTVAGLLDCPTYQACKQAVFCWRQRSKSTWPKSTENYSRTPSCKRFSANAPWPRTANRPTNVRTRSA